MTREELALEHVSKWVDHWITDCCDHDEFTVPGVRMYTGDFALDDDDEEDTSKARYDVYIRFDALTNPEFPDHDISFFGAVHRANEEASFCVHMDDIDTSFPKASDSISEMYWNAEEELPDGMELDQLTELIHGIHKQWMETDD